jgi:nicotinamide riboside kinase
MKKIVFTGPESTGKTTLANLISQQYKAPLVIEKARDFFEKRKETNYTFFNLLTIAIGQNELEQYTIKAYREENRNRKRLFVVCDTDLITIKIWMDEVFGKHSEWLPKNIKKDKTNDVLYLLCSPEGVAWEADPLRENPHDRDRLFKIYEKELNGYQKNYKILRGSVDERLAAACLEIERFLGNT